MNTRNPSMTKKEQRPAKTKKGKAKAKAPELTPDQEQWVKSFGSLDDYCPPEERARLAQEEKERHEAKAKKKAKRKKGDQFESIDTPAVYRERGYLVLAMWCKEGRVGYFSELEKTYRVSRVEDFLFAHKLRFDISPNYYALSLITRVLAGDITSTIDVYRRFIDMAMNREELLKLTAKAFQRQWQGIMKVSIPVDSTREELADQIIAKLAEEQENLSKQQSAPPEAATTAASAPAAEPGAPATTSNAPAPQQAPQPQQPKEKGINMTKKAAGGKKLSGAAAAKKKQGAANAKTVYPQVKKKNPFREGSKKAKSFDLFAKGGERGAILAGMKKLGVTDATAATWLNIFRKV